MARLASSVAENLDLEIIVEHLPKPSIKEGGDKEVNMARHKPGWASQIIKYLRDNEFLEDEEEVRKVKL